MSARRLTDADYARLLAFRVELRAFLHASERIAHAARLTPTLHQLLLVVRGHADPAGPTIGDVAAALDVRHHTAVELAQRAERAGLVDRARDEHDHRQVRLRLTDEGSARLDEVTRGHLPAIARLAERLRGVMDA
ncbi:MAG TPA: MarR family winged helix-turn-helix transcriptional regulator [Solirubrobacteraceae bacterium]|jgi:DNA-binding MarR family transcriptional regulator|nr:MarR family winged helix-turn-helix transcriptional regulator [Solirubrobacteraceae bacterium]